MKTMVGASSSATLNSSLTSFGPSPRYFCISSEPTTRKKVADVLFATALASSVLPVPGSPYKMTPCTSVEFAYLDTQLQSNSSGLNKTVTINGVEEMHEEHEQNFFALDVVIRFE